MNAPRLLNYVEEKILPKQLFVDLRIDKILSDAAISILRKPCCREEILRRQEMFLHLLGIAQRTYICDCLSVIKEYQTSLQLWQQSRVLYEKYHLQCKMLEKYVDSIDKLLSLDIGGQLFDNVRRYFLQDSKQQIRKMLREDIGVVKHKLAVTHRFLLSFSDKHWIAHNSGVDEYDMVAESAELLGFKVQQKRSYKLSVPKTLSDALFKLFETEMAEVETILGKYSDLSLWEPISYISELEFILEILDIANAATKVSIPICFPKVSEKRCFMARELYDISLFAKKTHMIVPNDVFVSESDSFYFLVGANGGGKTTYLRAIGVNLLLFLSGCPVFAFKAEIYPFSYVYAHYPVDERFEGVGRLEDEQHRIDHILSSVSGRQCFFLLNETFSGTGDAQGTRMLLKLAKQIQEANHCGIAVTHFRGIEGTGFPLLTAEVDEKDHTRTYKISRTNKCGSAFAADIIKKYGLDEESLLRRRSL